MTNKDVAIALCEMNLAVFPCDASKQPLTPNGFYDASIDESTISKWWKRFPDALPAIWPGISHVVVIDLDVKNGHNGIEAFKQLCDKHNINQSQFFAVQTPSKGVHLYFTSDKGFGNAHTLPDGIDVRSTAGYCLAPGAPGYEIICGSWDSVPALPSALVAYLTPCGQSVAPKLPTDTPTAQRATERERQYADNALADECAKLSAMREGEGRNSSLNTAALHMGEMVSAGWIDREVVESALWEASERNGYRRRDGDNAAMKTLQSGLQSGMANPRAPLSTIQVEPSFRAMIEGWIESFKAKQTSFIENIRSPFEYESAPLDYLVDDLIPLAAITMFCGKPGSGKSTLVMKLADAVSEGKCFLGRAAKPSRPVLYLDRENPLPIAKSRFEQLHIQVFNKFKYWGGHLSKPVPMPSDESIKEWVIKAKPKPLIIVDSLIRFVKGKENDSEAISAFFEPLRNLTHLGATVVVLHHPGKSESSQEGRGSSDIEAAIDVGYTVHNADRDKLTNMKFKLIKGRVTVANEVAFTYSNGEFIPQELKAAREHNLTQLLRMNPGIIKSEFEKLAMSKQASRNEVREFIETGIGFGTILTRQGERNAKLLYLPESIPLAQP